MPPEPPHSQSEDTTNEDSGAHQAELEGYQPLPAHAADDLNNLSDSSESSSDESDDGDAFSSEQRHRISMTIHWPEDESDQRPSRGESPPTGDCGGSQSSSAVEAERLRSLCQDRTAGHRRSTDRQAADRKEPSADRKNPSVGRKDSSADQKNSSTDRNDSSADRKGSSTDRKDSSADRKDSSADRKDSSADRKGSSTDRKDSSTDRKDSSTDRKDSSTDRKDSSTVRMSEDQTDAVRRAMQAVRLSEDAVPDWARGLSDQQCQQRIGHMLARITGHTS